MPRSETLSRALAITSSSCSNPSAANTGRAWPELAVRAVLCATAQIEQEGDSVLLAWLCVDSATAAHNISDRQNQVSHRLENRIPSRVELDSF